MNQRHKRPESVLVVVYDRRHHVLLLRRHKPDYFWQSPAGSLRWGEESLAAAKRELYEETGLSAGNLTECKATHRFVIYPMWRHRYAPGVIENTEYVFCLELKEPCDIVLDVNEHSEYQWLEYEESLQHITSHTNRVAVRRWVGSNQ